MSDKESIEGTLLTQAQNGYSEMKQYRKEEFESRMCALIHFSDYNDPTELWEKVKSCDKRPINYYVDLNKIIGWLSDFLKLGMIESAGDTQPAYRKNAILDQVLLLYEKDLRSEKEHPDHPIISLTKKELGKSFYGIRPGLDEFVREKDDRE